MITRHSTKEEYLACNQIWLLIVTNKTLETIQYFHNCWSHTSNILYEFDIKKQTMGVTFVPDSGILHTVQKNYIQTQIGLVPVGANVTSYMLLDNSLIPSYCFNLVSPV